MKRFAGVTFLFCLFTSIACAHDIQFITQYLDIKKQKTSGWQQDVLARVNLSRKLDLGMQATYMERFDVYDKRVGAFVGYSPTDRLFLEAKYLQGMGNELLPEKQSQLTAYYVFGSGYSGFSTLKNSRYAFTTLDTVNLGIEIEKIPSFIIIPQFMLGKATFKSPAETNDIYNYGLRLVFYRDKTFSVYGFGYRGKEATQGIVQISNIMVDTTTGGFGGGYYFSKNFRAELIVDHTDYEEIKNQFITTTLLLNYYF